MEDVFQIFTTFPSRAAADAASRNVLERKLAGCAQVYGPIASTYWWQGRLETSEEWLCILKTTSDRYPDLERELKALHPYEVPEILALPVQAGSTGYLEWLKQTLEP